MSLIDLHKELQPLLIAAYNEVITSSIKELERHANFIDPKNIPKFQELPKILEIKEEVKKHRPYEVAKVIWQYTCQLHAAKTEELQGVNHTHDIAEYVFFALSLELFDNTTPFITEFLERIQKEKTSEVQKLMLLLYQEKNCPRIIVDVQYRLDELLLEERKIVVDRAHQLRERVRWVLTDLSPDMLIHQDGIDFLMETLFNCMEMRALQEVPKMAHCLGLMRYIHSSWGELQEAPSKEREIFFGLVLRIVQAFQLHPVIHATVNLLVTSIPRLSILRNYYYKSPAKMPAEVSTDTLVTLTLDNLFDLIDSAIEAKQATSVKIAVTNESLSKAEKWTELPLSFLFDRIRTQPKVEVYQGINTGIDTWLKSRSKESLDGRQEGVLFFFYSLLGRNSPTGYLREYIQQHKEAYLNNTVLEDWARFYINELSSLN